MDARLSSSRTPSSPPPVAIILAAGVGRRLGEGHSGPKMLLRFAARTLLERRLTALAACGVREAVLTVGHEADRLKAEVARIDGPVAVSFVDNPRYREGSLLSLAVQRSVLTSGREVLVMDGDVLHDSRMVARLLAATGEAVILVDPELEAGDEPVKVCFRGGRIVDFRKLPVDAGERHGESVGFFRFSPVMAQALADQCDLRAQAAGGGGLEYEEAIRDLILRDPDRFSAADVGDLPWTEIDFEEDVAKARDLILPQLVD